MIEGGDDSGNHSTPIGRCLVKGLPENLPAKTPVKVTFEYEQNGRLCVFAKLPSVGVDAEMEIKRAAGLDEATIEKWTQLVEAGLPDDAVAEMAKADFTSATEQSQAVHMTPQARREASPTKKAQQEAATSAPPAEQPAASNEPATPSAPAAPVRKLGQPVRKLTQPVNPSPPATQQQPAAQQPAAQQPPAQKAAAPAGNAEQAGKKKSAVKSDWRSKARKLSND